MHIYFGMVGNLSIPPNINIAKGMLSPQTILSLTVMTFFGGDR